MTEINLDTWIVSDTHFGHYNMIKLCDRPLNFNEKIIDNWEKKVGDDDTLLHLGDVAIFFGPTTRMWTDRACELPPWNKLLIKGNHDQAADWHYRHPEGAGVFDVIPPFIQTFGKARVLFSHEPREPSDLWDINIHGHIHNNPRHRDGERDFDLDWRHINVSMEVMQYKPVRLKDLL